MYTFIYLHSTSGSPAARHWLAVPYVRLRAHALMNQVEILKSQLSSRFL